MNAKGKSGGACAHISDPAGAGSKAKGGYAQAQGCSTHQRILALRKVQGRSKDPLIRKFTKKIKTFSKAFGLLFARGYLA